MMPIFGGCLCSNTNVINAAGPGFRLGSSSVVEITKYSYWVTGIPRIVVSSSKLHSSLKNVGSAADVISVGA